MNAKKLFIIYIIMGMMGSITTQALPVVYQDYGFNANQIYNLISVVFLATIFQPIIGYIIDKFFSQKKGISILFFITGLISVILMFITEYNIMLATILVLSIFRIPLFPIVDGYVSTLTHKFNLNMGLIRAGSTVGYSLGLIVLILVLTLFNLTANFTFFFMGILCLILTLFVVLAKEQDSNEQSNNEQNKTNDIEQSKTKWDIFFLLLILQVLFFGFSILKVNYTSPFLMEHNYNAGIIALTTLMGIFPLLILMPLFSKIFQKFKYTSIIFFCILLNLLQTALFIIFPDNLIIIISGSFLTGFIFPLYSPTFGLFLRKALNAKFISTGFTIVFTLQNIFVFIFNQFVMINVLNVSGTITTAFIIIFGFFITSLIPLGILRYKKY